MTYDDAKAFSTPDGEQLKLEGAGPPYTAEYLNDDPSTFTVVVKDCKGHVLVMMPEADYDAMWENIDLYHPNGVEIGKLATMPNTHGVMIVYTTAEAAAGAFPGAEIFAVHVTPTEEQA